MSSGYCDRGVVIAHDLSEKLRSGEHRDAFLLCTGEFRVVRMDGCCVNNNVNRVLDVGSTLSVVEGSPFFLEKSGQRAFLRVRAGDGESLFQKDLSQSAHADSANTNEMDGDRFMKVYLIHNDNLLNLLTVKIRNSYANIIPLEGGNEKSKFDG